MDRSIQKSLLLTAVLCLSVSACRKNSDTPQFSQGILTENLGYCITCGGYDIKFSGDSLDYRIENDLSKFGITPDLKFPVMVGAVWQHDYSNNAGGRYVIIKYLKIDK